MCLPATSHATTAGIEIEHVDPSKILSMNIVNAQNTTDGDVSECVYRGKNSMAKVKTNETVEKIGQTSKEWDGSMFVYEFYFQTTRNYQKVINEFPQPFSEAHHHRTTCAILLFFVRTFKFTAITHL